MSRLVELLQLVAENSDEFQLHAVRNFAQGQHIVVMYAQQSQLDLYRQGQLAHLELHAVRVFPFTERVEVSL